jgi:hypothetical protein
MLLRFLLGFLFDRTYFAIRSTPLVFGGQLPLGDSSQFLGESDGTFGRPMQRNMKRTKQKNS